MLSSSVILTEPRTSADRFIQFPVIFLRSSTAANCRTSGDGELRTWCSNAGTSCGSLDNLRICSSACFRASLSGTRNCLSRSSSWSMATAPLAYPNSQPPPTTRLELALQQHARTQDRTHIAHRLQRRGRRRKNAVLRSPSPSRSLHERVAVVPLGRRPKVEVTLDRGHKAAQGLQGK